MDVSALIAYIIAVGAGVACGFAGIAIVGNAIVYFVNQLPLQYEKRKRALNTARVSMEK